MAGTFSCSMIDPIRGNTTFLLQHPKGGPMSAPTPPVEERQASAQSALVDWAGRAGRALAIALGSVLFAFVVGGVIVAVTKGNPLLTYQSLICGGFGVFCVNGENPVLQLSFTLVFTTPLILAGLAVAVAFRAGLFNIGAE